MKPKETEAEIYARANLTLMATEAAIDGWVTMPQVYALLEAMRAGRPWTDENRSTFWRIHHADIVRHAQNDLDARATRASSDAVH